MGDQGSLIAINITIRTLLYWVFNHRPPSVDFPVGEGTNSQIYKSLLNYTKQVDIELMPCVYETIEKTESL